MMSANVRKLPTDFGPEAWFELRPLPAVPYRQEQETRFEQLKRKLLLARLAETWEPELNSLIRRAANEAASLTWVTPYPALFFPALFEEKIQEALKVAERQVEVRVRSRELLAV